jgi:hypothetical protein
MIEAIAILAGFFLILAMAAYATNDHSKPPRMDNRIPEREYELLGDDWRTHCVQFANIRRARRLACIHPEEQKNEHHD